MSKNSSTLTNGIDMPAGIVALLMLGAVITTPYGLWKKIGWGIRKIGHGLRWFGSCIYEPGPKQPRDEADALHGSEFFH